MKNLYTLIDPLRLFIFGMIALVASSFFVHWLHAWVGTFFAVWFIGTQKPDCGYLSLPP